MGHDLFLCCSVCYSVCCSVCCSADSTQVTLWVCATTQGAHVCSIRLQIARLWFQVFVWQCLFVLQYLFSFCVTMSLRGWVSLAYTYISFTYTYVSFTYTYVSFTYTCLFTYTYVSFTYIYVSFTYTCLFDVHICLFHVHICLFYVDTCLFDVSVSSVAWWFFSSESLHCRVANMSLLRTHMSLLRRHMSLLRKRL